MTATILKQPENAFRSAMSLAVTGVNIVTTDGPLGRYGLTVSAVSSVSTEPPMVLVCVNQNSVASNRHPGETVRLLLTYSQAANDRSPRPSRAATAMVEPINSTARTGRLKSPGRPCLKVLSRILIATSSQSFPRRHTQSSSAGFMATAECPDTPLLYTGRRYGQPRRSVNRNPAAQLIAGTKTVLERFCA